MDFWDLINWCTIFSLACLILVKEGDSKYCVSVVASTTLFFEIFGEYICNDNGSTYYASVALVELLTIHLLTYVKVINKLVIDMQNVLLWFIVAHIVGWVLYEYWFTPDIYNTLCLALFIIMFITMLRSGSGQDVGTTTLRRNWAYIFSRYI